MLLNITDFDELLLDQVQFRLRQGNIKIYLIGVTNITFTYKMVIVSKEERKWNNIITESNKAVAYVLEYTRYWKLLTGAF